MRKSYCVTFPLYVMLFLGFQGSFLPTANSQEDPLVPDPCSSIISLGGGGSANAKTFTETGTGVWYTSTLDPCGWSCPGIEQIYSIVAPYTGVYSIAVTSTNGTWVDYMWRSGSCGTSWNCIQALATAGTYGSMSWTAGTTYYILLDAESTITSSHVFYVFLNPCLNITAIGGTGPGNSVTYSGGGNGGWFTNTASPCGWFCPGIESIYSFVAPYFGYYSIQVTGTTEYFVDYMWSTSCSSTGWNCIHNIDSPGTYGSMFMTAGTTYYFLLDDEDNVVGSQTFYINPPDPCLGLIPMTCGQQAGFLGGGPGVWNTVSCGYSCPGVEQVYKFVAPTTGQYSIQVSVASSWVDYMWSTSCSSGAWNCISDIGSPGQYGSMSWTAGTTYYIMLDDEDNISSYQVFSIVCPALCHDCPTYDFMITPTVGWQTSSSSIDPNGCKIYQFYALNGAYYTFKTGCGDGATADFDTYLALFNSNCTQVAINDDACVYPLSKIEWSTGVSGYYYLKVYGFGGASGNYTLAYAICYYAPDQPGAIAGPANIINGTAEPYSISAVTGATSYSWTYSGGGSIVGSGPGITLTATTSGLLSVTANNACGNSVASTLSINVLPVNMTVQNVWIFPGPPQCYEASQTITLAGGGTFFFVQSGASIELVAGQNILLEPGVQVQNGGYLHGWIATTGNYCVQVPGAPVVNGGDETSGMSVPVAQNKDSFFKVYPNPTTGNFTLELFSEPDGAQVKVQIYSLLGSLITETAFYTGKQHELTLMNEKPGLYIMKVTQNENTGMQKIIRQ